MQAPGAYRRGPQPRAGRLFGPLWGDIGGQRGAAGRSAPAAPHLLRGLLRRPPISYEALAPFDPDRPELPKPVREAVEIAIKYQGYIDRQLRQVEEMKKLEDRRLPDTIDYTSIEGLRLEARQKLSRIRPKNLGQASRVSGVSPADVAVLMVYLKQREGK